MNSHYCVGIVANMDPAPALHRYPALERDLARIRILVGNRLLVGIRILVGILILSTELWIQVEIFRIQIRHLRETGSGSQLRILIRLLRTLKFV